MFVTPRSHKRGVRASSVRVRHAQNIRNRQHLQNALELASKSDDLCKAIKYLIAVKRLQQV